MCRIPLILLVAGSFFFLSAQVTASSDESHIDQENYKLFYEEVVKSLFEPEEFLTKPKEFSTDTPCPSSLAFDVCKTATKLENIIFDEPSDKEIIAYRSEDKVILQCERYTDCYLAHPCARSEHINHTMEVCSLYRQVVSTMSTCLNKIKDSMNIEDWKMEYFVGPMGLFREKFNFYETWKGWYAYHPSRCNKLRQHLRKFRGLITETCGEPMWKQYHWHVNATNTFPGLCLIENLDD